MSINLETVRTIAAELVHQKYEQVEVLGVRAGGGDYVEILLSLKDCEIEPCRVIAGVFRDGDIATVRSAVSEALRNHLDARSQEE